MNQETLTRGGNLVAATSVHRADLPNVSVKYMYRDGSNYKCFETVIFANPKRINVRVVWRDLNDALKSVTLFPEQPIFRPEWVGLPTVFLFALPGYSRNDDDHDWHELVAVKETDNPSTFRENAEISSFIDALRRTHAGANSRK